MFAYLVLQNYYNGMCQLSTKAKKKIPCGLIQGVPIKLFHFEYPAILTVVMNQAV